jgi:NADPH:quinone reductase-like Zn-dependent oxidoreductase
MLPAVRGGGYAEFATVPEQDAAHVPRNVTFVEAAATPLAGLTALQALRDQARLQAGARVLIHGASGGVGTYAVQIAKAMGAHVTAVCSSRNGALVRDLGADAVVDYTQTDVTTLDGRFDVLFDAVDTLSFLRVRQILRKGGVMVSVNPLVGKLVPGLCHVNGVGDS